MGDRYFPECVLIDDCGFMEFAWQMYFRQEQTNLSAAVTGPASSTGGHVVLFADTSGQVLLDGGPTAPFGLSLLALANAVAGRAAFALGTISTQDANAVAVTGGSVAGTTFDADTVSTYLDFIAQGANPPAPAAGTVRFHSSTNNGFTRFEQDNEAPTNIILGRDNVFIAKNTSGATIGRGQPVYVTGSAVDVPTVGLAKADATATLPAVGVALDSILNNAFGQIMKLGIMTGLNTSLFAAADNLWVSQTTAGRFTNVRPPYPNYVQRMASVLVSDATVGSILVVTAPFIGMMESGTNSLTYTFAGTAQVTGAFGCNTKTPQAAFASGGAAPAGGVGTAAGGWDTAAHRDSAITLLNNIRSALVANGIMT